MIYKGFTIEKYEGTQVGYAKVLSREHNHRKYSGWSFTDSEGYERIADTLREAKRRIDDLTEGSEEIATDESRSYGPCGAPDSDKENYR